MKIKVASGDIVHLPVDAVIINLFEGIRKPGGATAAIDSALGGAISRLIAEKEIRGRLREVTIIHTLGRISPQRVVVVGLGKQKDFNQERLRGVMGEACRALRKVGARQVASILHGRGAGGLQPEAAAQAIAEGCPMGLYTFHQHQAPSPDKRELRELQIIVKEPREVTRARRGVSRGLILAEAVALARDMGNQPANFMTPTLLAEEALKVAQQHGLEVEILEREKMQELGMGGMLGVSQGSGQPPKFIILTYRGCKEEQPALGLVGKGITFDSGGISLKPSEGMGDMKGDMSGAAAVIAAMKAIAQLKVPLNVTGLIPATENLPSGHALKPGDIIRILNGKTVEIASTDAEGRLVLADALSYARQQGLTPLVDLATLTGACHIALGDHYSGAFGNNQGFVERVVAAGKGAGERHWPMPTDADYKEQNKSDVADIKNTGGRYGGAITAALFLGEFVGNTPWVHLDIAGTFRSDKDQGYVVKGATGVGVGTLVNLALALSHKKKGVK
ncbi:MAG: leucyl aminopeptidase [Dehalococcoidia bacterium]|nr:leucyl aminopeptidase [Dehalococcoidia bacterium]